MKENHSVWDALEGSSEDTANMKVRAELMINLQERMKRQAGSQAEKAARGIGVRSCIDTSVISAWALNYPRPDRVPGTFRLRLDGHDMDPLFAAGSSGEFMLWVTA